MENKKIIEFFKERELSFVIVGFIAGLLFAIMPNIWLGLLIILLLSIWYKKRSGAKYKK